MPIKALGNVSGIVGGSSNGRIRTLFVFSSHHIDRMEASRAGEVEIQLSNSVRECRFDSCPIHPHRRYKKYEKNSKWEIV